jgi:signal transduction histidine kinase
MRKLLLGCLLIAVVAPHLTAMGGAGKIQTVLVLYSNDRSLPANMQVDERLRETLAVTTNLDLRYQTEYLDYPRYGDEADSSYDKLFSDFLRAKYASEPISVIVAGGPQAYRFLLRHQDDLFVHTPVIVAVAHSAFVDDPPTQARFLDIPSKIEPRPTIELAMRLQPQASEILIVTGMSRFDRDWERNLRAMFTTWHAHPPVRYLAGLPLNDVLSQLSHLSRNTIVYSPGFQMGGGERAYNNRDVVRQMAEASSAPIYSSYSTMINFGIVGGYIFQMADVGDQTGQVVQRILNGEALTQKDMPAALPSHFVVDWRKMKRWNLPAANLPPGTIIVNREPTAWQRYKATILFTLMLLVVQALLILYLLAERRRRQRAQEQLAERIQVEQLVAKVSTEFANLESGQVNLAILRTLHYLHGYSPTSIVCIWQLREAGDGLACTHMWPEDSEKTAIAEFPDRCPEVAARMSQGDPVIFSGRRKAASPEVFDSCRSAGIKSLLAIPIQSENRVLGTLSLANTTEAKAWSKDIMPQFGTIADILGGALARQNTTEALAESEVLRGVILDYMQSDVLVIDKDGIVLEVNQHWINSASRDNAASRLIVGVGVNYLDACQLDIGGGEAAQSLLGIRSVLNGTRQTFETEYSSPSPSTPRWFRMTVMRLPRPSGGALIIHFEITQQKLAELERAKMQEEMAQLHRATEMGQLVASLAHELAQPLAAVLSNAQAASRLAARSEPDLIEIRAALSDIIEDDQRARAVLNNVRALLKRHAITPHKVNLNEIVENVILMVRASAQLRGVQLQTLLSEEAVFVQGDEVPLQQVLLNLVNNAMDAMEKIPLERRLLTLKTIVQPQTGSGLLLVTDQGPGISDTVKERFFEPFFTTKGEGLGMGLAICQTILQTLGGSLELSDNSEAGATFLVQLPPAA